MQKGFATLIGLLIATIIFIFLAMAIIKSFSKGYISKTESQSVENQAQDAVNKYQQKGIENQMQDLNLDQ